MTKYQQYDEIKKNVESKAGEVGAYKEINYGIQFEVTYKQQTGKVRVYESKKKGVTIDLSQIKNEALKDIVSNRDTSMIISHEEKREAYQSDEWSQSLIGVDESGKGDYFGPLVIGAVYADEDIKEKLVKIGVADSKKLSDKQVREMAKQIEEFCEYEVLIITNEIYNKLYDKIQNLNNLLAKGHGKVIETLAKKTGAKLALSDQFGSEKLILQELTKNQVDIVLEQRPYAESNVVVAAASILARHAFVEELEKMNKHYNQIFPKGAGPKTLEPGRRYIQTFGKAELHKVAKLHFKTTTTL